MAKEPFAIPVVRLSSEKAPITLPDTESFQNWMINTPDVMNMAAPISEKKRSKKKNKEKN